MGDFSLLLGNTLKAAAAAALTGNSPVQDKTNAENVIAQPQAIVVQAKDEPSSKSQQPQSQVVSAIVEPYTTGDIPLASIRAFPKTSLFGDYLRGISDNDNIDMSKRYKSFVPTINTYYTVDGDNRVEIRGDDSTADNSVLYTTFLRDGALNYGGYANKEQMFCYTLTSVIVEDFHFNREVTKKSIKDVLDTIITGYGTFDFNTFRGTGHDYESGVGRVKYIDEFGGPLLSNVKKTYLMTLLSKKSSDLEAMRYYTQKEGAELYKDCYKSVGGDLSYDPSEFVPLTNDFLFNTVPEFRNYIAKIKSANSLEDARRDARAARDNKVKAEQDAKIQEEQNRLTDERNRQQALQALHIEQQNKEAAIAADAEAESASRRQKELNRQKALQSLGR